MRKLTVSLICSIALGFWGTRVHATMYTVTSTAMTEAWDGQCTLVEAINASNSMAADHECAAGTGDDTIQLGGGTFTTIWTLNVSNRLTINGAGTPATIIAGDFSPNLQDLLFGVNGWLQLNNLTVRNDTGPSSNFTSGIVGWDNALIASTGGLRVTGFTLAGIRTDNASVDLRHAKIDHNTNFLPQSPWNNGGGISLKNDDPSMSNGIFLYDSSIIWNQSSGDGGGMYFGGNGNTQVHYNTFANNQAARGGGIFIATNTGGYFQSSHLSVGANTATVSGGGIEEHHQGSLLQIDSAIVANNSAPSGANLVRTAPGGFSRDCIWGAGVTAAVLGCTGNWGCSHNTYGADAKFGPLMTMGGTYYLNEVLPLRKGSPAIDYGADEGAEPLDQRGLSGNQDGNNNGSAAVDAGAFEANLVWQSEEMLEWTNSSNDIVVIDVDSGYSGGLGRRLQASGSGDFVTYPVPIPEAGTYDITIRIKKTSNAGRFKVGTASSLNGTYTYFTPDQDGYSGTTTVPPSFSLGTRTFNSAQKYYVRFQVTGKNSSSNGYDICTDYVKVRKTN